MAASYTGQSMASARKAKIMETPPVENRSRSDIACPLAVTSSTRRAKKDLRLVSRRALSYGTPILAETVAAANMATIATMIENAKPIRRRPAWPLLLFSAN